MAFGIAEEEAVSPGAAVGGAKALPNWDQGLLDIN